MRRTRCPAHSRTQLNHPAHCTNAGQVVSESEARRQPVLPELAASIGPLMASTSGGLAACILYPSAWSDVCVVHGGGERKLLTFPPSHCPAHMLVLLVVVPFPTPLPFRGPCNQRALKHNTYLIPHCLPPIQNCYTFPTLPCSYPDVVHLSHAAWLLLLAGKEPLDEEALNSGHADKARADTAGPWLKLGAGAGRAAGAGAAPQQQHVAWQRRPCFHPGFTVTGTQPAVMLPQVRASRSI